MSVWPVAELVPHAGDMILIDEVLAFVRVVASSVSTRTKVVLWNLTGIGGFDGGEADEDGEQAHEQEVFSALGIVSRPRAPSTVGGEVQAAEAVAARTSDGMVALGARDARLHRRFPNPKEGTVALVGYGGAFLAFDDTGTNSGDEPATIATLYLPFNWSGGVPASAHSISLDPVHGISVVHANGQAVLMQDDGSIRLQSPDGQSFLQITDGRLDIQSEQVVLNGSVFVGDPIVAKAACPAGLSAGGASQPCPRLFVAPTA